MFCHRFQSTPLVVEGRSPKAHDPEKKADRVSIHAPRCRGAKPISNTGVVTVRWQFQSTPLVVEGRSTAGNPSALATCSFNPRPSLSRGEAGRAPRDWRCAGVSIHAPRCRGAKPPGLFVSDDMLAVSIHAPRCRGAKQVLRLGSKAHQQFQSTPLVVEGRSCALRGRRSPAIPCFNPRPSLSRGEAGLSVVRSAPCPVSIHAPRCRGAKPPVHSNSGEKCICFNPRPSLSRGEAPCATWTLTPSAVSIHAPRCRGAKRLPLICVMPATPVSIHAPRCRGAKPAGLHATGDVLVFQSTPLVVEGRSDCLDFIS